MELSLLYFTHCNFNVYTWQVVEKPELTVPFLSDSLSLFYTFILCIYFKSV